MNKYFTEIDRLLKKNNISCLHMIQLIYKDLNSQVDKNLDFSASEKLSNLDLMIKLDSFKELENMIEALRTYQNFAFKRFFVDCKDNLDLEDIFKLSQARLVIDKDNEYSYKPYHFVSYTKFLQDTNFNEERLYLFMQRNVYWFLETLTSIDQPFTMFQDCDFEMTISPVKWRTEIYKHGFNGRNVSPLHYLMYRLTSPYLAEISVVNDIFYMKQTNEPAVIISYRKQPEKEEITLIEAEERLKYIKSLKPFFNLQMIC